MTPTEIIEAYSCRPVMMNATLGELGMDSLDVLAMTFDIEEACGLNIDDHQWSVETRVQVVLSDIEMMRDPRN